MIRIADAVMAKAAHQLQPVRKLSTKALTTPVTFLTGRRFAHLTAFCAWSLEHFSGRQLTFHFFDDGTVREMDRMLLSRLFPSSIHYNRVECEHAIKQHLPVERFPSLHFALAHSPFMKKLLDMRAGRTGPSLYLDSDMLFFGHAQQLISWLERPAGQIYMHDPGWDAYVDNRTTLEEKLKTTLLSGLNGGILALDNEIINWDQLEQWATVIGRRRLTHNWTEQTLWSLILQREDSIPANADDYKICSRVRQLSDSIPIMRHYVYQTKLRYRLFEWRRCLALAKSLPT